MREVYVYHHLGLGDHIICSGMVKELTSYYDKINLFVKKHNHKSVESLYDERFNYILVDTDQDVINYLHHYKSVNLIKIGFENLNRYIPFDKSFYEQFNIPFENRWENFSVKRNLENEKKVFEYYNIKENEYIFLHDDTKRNYNIKLKSDIKIIKPVIGLTENIFDYYYVIQNAKEIHCFDSSFRLFIDSIELNIDKIYFYNSLRGIENCASSKKQWIIKK